MSATRHAWRGTLVRMFAATALIGAVATAPADATPTSSTRSPLVHQLPKLPIVVDGVRYAPEQIHRFDGRPLFMHLSGDGKTVIAYTRVSAFRRFLHRRG